MAPADASWHFKQAITPSKLHGGVGGFTSATAFADGEGLDRRRYFRKMDGRLHRFYLEIQERSFLSASKPRLAEGSPQQQLLAERDVITLSHPRNFMVHSLGCGSGTGGVFGMLAGEGVVKPFSFICLQDGYPPENLLIGEGQIPLLLFSELQYTFC